MRSLCALRCHTPATPTRVTNPEAQMDFRCFEFLLGAYYMGIVESLTGHLIELNLPVSSSPCRSRA